MSIVDKIVNFDDGGNASQNSIFCTVNSSVSRKNQTNILDVNNPSLYELLDFNSFLELYFFYIY